MQHIDLNAHGEAVQQFFLSIPPDPEGAVVEFNGQALARLMPVNGQQHGAADVEEPWTAAKNARRSALIDHDIEGRLTPAEAVELEGLQRQMLRERRRLAPVPLEELQRLHQELLTKAQAHARQGDA